MSPGRGQLGTQGHGSVTAATALPRPHGVRCAWSRRRTPGPRQRHVLLLQTAVEPLLLLPVLTPLPLLLRLALGLALGLMLGLMLRQRLLSRDDRTSG